MYLTLHFEHKFSRIPYFHTPELKVEMLLSEQLSHHTNIFGCRAFSLAHSHCMYSYLLFQRLEMKLESHFDGGKNSRACNVSKEKNLFCKLRVLCLFMS